MFKKEKVERPGSSDGGPATTTVPVTSLPDGALRSPKALKILGVPAPVVNANVFDNLSGSHDRKKGDATSRFEIAPWERDEPRVVRKSASKSFGVPWLTQKQEAVPGQQTNESTTAVSTLERFRSAATNKKAMWMLGLRPLSSRPRSAGNDSDSSSEHGRLLGDRGKEASGYHSDGSSRLRSEPRRGGIRSRRRARRKKAPKSLERMSPIVEAKSSEDEEELEDEDDEDEDDAELDVISEYSTLKAKAAPMGRSITAPTLSIKFVDEQEARSEDPGYEGEEEEDQQGKWVLNILWHDGPCDGIRSLTVGPIYSLRPRLSRTTYP